MTQKRLVLLVGLAVLLWWAWFAPVLADAQWWDPLTTQVVGTVVILATSGLLVAYGRQAGVTGFAVISTILRNRGARRGIIAIVVLVFLWVLNIFDLTVTLVNVNAGGFQEANPIAATLLHSPAHLAAYKLTLVTAASIIFIAYRRSRIAEIGCWGACLVYLALAHVWQVYHG